MSRHNAVTSNPSSSQKRPALIAAVLLVLTTGFLFWPARQNEFLVYDDHDYVTGNPAVQRGLGWETVKWAFTSGHAANWHPLTWLSHALDWQMHGLNPAGHHQTSVLLHALNAGLLLLLLAQLTGQMRRSAFVAAVFAWHPLRVESVAWVAERKDLLCGLFFLLTLIAYAKYVSGIRGSGVERVKTFKFQPSTSSIKDAWGWYGISLLCFALGLMSKPMLVTLPFVLLLLDYWPLNRVSGAGTTQLSPLKSLVVEKLPFLALALASCVATYAAQKAGGAVREFGLESRVANIPLAYLRYLEKFFYPDSLAIIYPFKPVTGFVGVLAALILAALCGVAILRARKQPFGFVGWFWFVGMLVPVIGFIQVGYQAFADRYTYLPGIGLTIVVAWSVLEICQRWKLPQAFPIVAGVALLAPLPGLTRHYLAQWKNTTTVFEYSVRSTGPHTIALKNMGLAYMEQGRLDKSQTCFEQSLAIEPDDQPTLFNLGSVLLQQRRAEEALPHLRKLADAKVQPHEAPAYAKVGLMLADNAQYADAIRFYEQALTGDPNQLDALNNLAWLRATTPDAQWRSGSEAVRLADRACELSGRRIPVLLGTLAAAYAEAGRFPEAITTAELARRLALARQEPAVANSNEQLLELYRAGKPVRETP